MLSFISNPMCWGAIIVFIMGQFAIDTVSAMQYKKDKKNMQDAEEHKQHQYA
jgi:hypothetical protein